MALFLVFTASIIEKPIIFLEDKTMEEKIRELLKKLSTQLDGVEALCKELHELGMSNIDDDKWIKSKLAQQIRIQTECTQGIDLCYARENMQKIEDALKETDYFPDKK